MMQHVTSARQKLKLCARHSRCKHYGVMLRQDDVIPITAKDDERHGQLGVAPDLPGKKCFDVRDIARIGEHCFWP